MVKRAAENPEEEVTRRAGHLRGWPRTLAAGGAVQVLVYCTGP